jgi:hypothetical protein
MKTRLSTAPGLRHSDLMARRAQYMKRIILMLLILFCITGCSKPAPDILTEMSGVWRFSDNSFLAIKHENGSVSLTSGNNVVTGKVGTIDAKNRTVKLRVILPDGLDAVWTLKQMPTADSRTFYLELTLHNGKTDILQSVR